MNSLEAQARSLLGIELYDPTMYFNVTHFSKMSSVT